MNLPRSISVLKFGSSVLSDLSKLPRVVEEIYSHRRKGNKVLAVVSAIGNTTDELIREAKLAKIEPSSRALALLLATGETRSVALVTLACQESGITAAPIPAHEIGLLTDGERLNARPVHVDTRGLLRQFEDHDVLVVPGFVGIDISGETSLLGRGGSDLTAVYLAKAINAETCCLLKDTAGVFEFDPAIPNRRPRLFETLSFIDAKSIDGDVLQEKAVCYAEKLDRDFEVKRIGGHHRTQVCQGNSYLQDWHPDNSQANVALLGCGQVGGAVLDRIREHEPQLQIAGVAVRSIAKHKERVPQDLLVNDACRLASGKHDIVIELIGDVTVALPSIRRALENGNHVVTANKELVAAHGNALKILALAKGLQFRFSAAVGGSVPIIEIVRQRQSKTKRLIGIEGVLNGTSNFILDQLDQGHDLSTAIEAAQEAGLCEADADNDLNGNDAARKLVILANEALAQARHVEVVRLGDISHMTGDFCAAARESSSKIRQVAKLVINQGEVTATVGLEAVPSDSFLGQCAGAENRVILSFSDGSTEKLSGLGAGPAPTAESVLADVLEIKRQFSHRPHHRQLKEIGQ
ncbi:MAG: homoserine dehydrogenase [Planctomycetota bacterium]|jgi:homoserine dehydrogenase